MASHGVHVQETVRQLSVRCLKHTRIGRHPRFTLVGYRLQLLLLIVGVDMSNNSILLHKPNLVSTLRKGFPNLSWIRFVRDQGYLELTLSPYYYG